MDATWAVAILWGIIGAGLAVVIARAAHYPRNLIPVAVAAGVGALFVGVVAQLGLLWLTIPACIGWVFGLARALNGAPTGR